MSYRNQSKRSNRRSRVGLRASQPATANRNPLLIARLLRCERLESRCLMHGMPWNDDALWFSDDTSAYEDSRFDLAAMFSAWEGEEDCGTRELVAEGEGEDSWDGPSGGPGRDGPIRISDAWDIAQRGTIRPSLDQRNVEFAGGDRGRDPAWASGKPTPKLPAEPIVNNQVDQSAKRIEPNLTAERGQLGQSSSNTPLLPATTASVVGSDSKTSLHDSKPLASNGALATNILLSVQIGRSTPEQPATLSPTSSSNVSAAFSPSNVLSLLRGNASDRSPDGESGGSSEARTPTTSIRTATNTGTSASAWPAVLQADKSSLANTSTLAVQASASLNEARSLASSNDSRSVGRVAASSDLSHRSVIAESVQSTTSNDGESAGLLRELRSVIDRLAQQRQSERAEASADEHAHVRGMEVGYAEQMATRRHMPGQLDTRGLLELRTDRDRFAPTSELEPYAAEESIAAANRAATFATIGLYREFDLVVDSPNSVESFVDQGNPVRNAGRAASGLNSWNADVKATDSVFEEALDGENTVFDRTVLPLSFLTLGGMLLIQQRRRKHRPPRADESL